MDLSRAWQRHIGGVGLAALALVVTACASTPQTSQPSVTAPQVTETTSPAPQQHECTGTGRVGSLSMTGSGGSQITPEATSFFCETGPFISLTRISNNAVTFTAAGAPVTIPNGSSATVGPYQIMVLSIDAGTANFKVISP
jgi:hypothetical protein